jgi:N-acetylglucosaminyl-diphospho-decaprenol L-rhamnosyltransferase
VSDGLEQKGKNLPVVGVVIVAFNSSETISECVTSCLVDPAVASAVVVDNARETACRRIVETIGAQDPRVQYLVSDNLGFSRGCNFGVERIGSCDTVAFINPDVEVTRSLGELATRLKGSRCAIVSGRLLDPEHPEAINARPLVSFGRELLAAFVGDHRAYAVRSIGTSSAHEQEVEVGQVAGAMLLISASHFAMLNGFDEQFELYYDDVDLSARASNLGGSLLINEQWGIHHGGASAASVPSLAYCVGTVSRVRYLRKRYGNGVLTSAGVVAVACAELISRTASRRSEGQAARFQAFRLQIRELRNPGTVRVLT